MDNEWTRRIRELEAEAYIQAVIVAEKDRKLERLEWEIERLKEAIRSEVA